MSSIDFEAHRDHLQAVARRLLGSAADAEDAVQEAWLRLSRADDERIENARAWLTTVVARISLDMLRSRTARREVPLEERPAAQALGPEGESELADSVGLALLIVLDRLSPAERLAFVLHDMFAVPFREIAPILDRSADATKMLASRARRRVRDAQPPTRNQVRQQQVVAAFLAAARSGKFAALFNLLDPDVFVHADAAASPTGVSVSMRGAERVARQAAVFAQLAGPSEVGLVDGVPSVLVTSHGRLDTVLAFTFSDSPDCAITEIEIIGDPEQLTRKEIRTGWPSNDAQLPR